MKYRKLIILAIAVLAAAYAGSRIVSTSDSDSTRHEDAGHGHAHGGQHGRKSAQVTVWSDRFEVFLEHPFVIAGTPTEFVTHVTDRVTLQPRRKGPVTFVLSDGSATRTRHVEQTPTRDGIYIPKLTFPKSGMWNVSLVIPVGATKHLVELPALTVYGSQAQVDRAASPEEIVGISFLKEQQWKIPFATEAVQRRKILSEVVPAVPESAIVDENGKPAAFVQLSGETFEKRYVRLGNKGRGLVQVLSGLSEGEYVTTKGVDAIVEAEHEVHAGESAVQLSEEDMRKFGIEVDAAGSGEFEVCVSVPGEIKFNANKVAHIVPTVPGVVREVISDIGDTVAAGEVLAWLESTKLGGAKVEYLARQSEVSCCSVELVRAQEVYDNSMKLLETLNGSPSLETLRKMNGSAMGMNRSLLVSAYAEFIFARETYLREKDLYEKKISSKEDFLKAESAFRKADAQYVATRDSVSFEVHRNLLEARRTQRIREIELKAAERLLYVFGLTTQDVNDLAALANNQAREGEEEECTDPNCTECAAKSAGKGRDTGLSDLRRTNEKLAWYPIRAPFDGTIINKHITLGEVVSDDAGIFVVADLDTVWVDLQVHQKDLAVIKKGQEVMIWAKSLVPETRGVIDYVDPVIDEKTRTALARVVLDNSAGQLRPGTFITANVLARKLNAEVVVSKSALQDVDDKTCVFVQGEHGFEPRAVTIGLSNDEYVEIVAGLRPGEKIVTKNSFRLKAELKKDAGGGHAGHGHAH
ncbi:MAG: efflux RND transporter periplasmic adaptor subunit [Planctomycetota bacterium]|jgi:multidrug efflux pump subunit AcrA (membrane-fusion protein)